jgi:hypothetical protein
MKALLLVIISVIGFALGVAAISACQPPPPWNPTLQAPTVTISLQTAPATPGPVEALDVTVTPCTSSCPTPCVSWCATPTPCKPCGLGSPTPISPTPPIETARPLQEHRP